jgi:C-terminal processing protease CtpA/Prc
LTARRCLALAFLPALISLLSIVTGEAVPAAVAEPPGAEAPFTRQQMEEDLRQLAAVTRRAWAYAEDKQANFGVDVDRLLAEALGRLDGVTTRADFAGVLAEFMAGLREGHAEVGVAHLEPVPARRWPFRLAEVREGLIIVGLDPSVGRDAGLDVGDLVKTIDGRPVEEYVRAAWRRTSASGDGARRKLAIARLGPTDAATLTVEAERLDGAKVTAAVKTIPRDAPPPAPVKTPFAEGRVLEGNVGYVRIPSFSYNTAAFAKARTTGDRDQVLAPAKREIDQAFAAVADTPALVLDLRGNGGGYDLLGVYLAEHLLAGDFVYYSTWRRRSPDLEQHPDHAAIPREYWERKLPWQPRKVPDLRHAGGPVYAGRLLVLINEHCFSATDNLCACLADLHPNVRFVGRPTNGGTGGPTVIAKLKHSQADVQFCVLQVWSPAGRLIEGRGTKPDVPVQWTRADVIEKRDPDLAAALWEAQR